MRLKKPISDRNLNNYQARDAYSHSARLQYVYANNEVHRICLHNHKHCSWNFTDYNLGDKNSRRAHARLGAISQRNEPGVDDLDAGLHAGPRPVVRDRARDPRQPQRPLRHKQEEGRAFRPRTTLKRERGDEIYTCEERLSGGGSRDAPTARSLCSTTHSLNDCSVPFSSAILPSLPLQTSPPIPCEFRASVRRGRRGERVLHSSYSERLTCAVESRGAVREGLAHVSRGRWGWGARPRVALVSDAASVVPASQAANTVRQKSGVPARRDFFFLVGLFWRQNKSCFSLLSAKYQK